MNFFDTYELSTTPTHGQPQQSLNEEVTDVIGQFGRLWGTFRKQSQTALEIARRDIGGVVNQAQRELSKLTTGDSPNPHGDVTGNESEGTSTTPTEHEVPSALSTPAIESNASPPTFFSRLQSVIPPNIASVVRSNLPETLKHASENLDFVQLQTNLMTELQRVQGLTRAQAEEYVHKSESLLREAVKEAGVVLREAVKIVPPEEAQVASSSSAAGTTWDGTDMWMLPSDPSMDGSEEPAITDKTGRSPRQATETQRAVATRAEALSRRLKHDPSIIRHDPESDDALKDYFSEWLAQAEEGFSFWSQEAAVLLEEPNDGPALHETLNTLVPSEMNEETFWKRFFFRVHQIAQEEERRKALIEASAVETDEYFSWGEDEDEEAGSPTTISPKKSQLTVTRTSSREGSDASYDVVSNATSGQDEKDKGEEEEEEESEWE